MAREEDAARELVRSLEGPNKDAAIFQRATLTNHVTQNKARVDPLELVGIPYNSLSKTQQALAMEIIDTYLGVLPKSITKAHLDRIQKSGLNGRFWRQPRPRPYYCRLRVNLPPGARQYAQQRDAYPQRLAGL
jgi:hypothetical protein